MWASRKNGTGSISLSDLEDGLRKLGVFEGMSAQQAALATKRFDTTGDATVSLVEFLAFAGKPYTANDGPLEAKLRRVLLKAESVRHTLLKKPASDSTEVENKKGITMLV